MSAGDPIEGGILEIGEMRCAALKLGRFSPMTLKDAGGEFVEVATISCVKDNRGGMNRIRTQFADGVAAESETVAGRYSWKEGEILIQHQFHDGRGRCRLAVTGAVDSAGGLAWVIDSTTTDPSGAEGQMEAAPISINVGEANGQYLIFFADGRIRLKTPLGEWAGSLNQLIALFALSQQPMMISQGRVQR